MIALLRSEFLKLRTTRTALGLLIAAMAISLLPGIIMFFVASSNYLHQTESLVVAVLGLSIVPTLAFVFGILGMTNEYRHGTVTTTYLASPHRGRVIVIKLVAYALVGAAVMIVTGLATLILVSVGYAVRGATFPSVISASQITLADVRNVALFVGSVGLSTAFGVALGALVRAQVTTIAGGLVWGRIVEPIILGLKPAIAVWLPFTVFEQLWIGDLGTGLASHGLSRPEAFLVAMLYICGVSALAVFTSMRRDVT